jgi:hypothetical protein
MNGEFASRDNLNYIANFNFDNNKYLKLKQCFQKLRKKTETNQTFPAPLNLQQYFMRIKKGSKQYRKILTYTPKKENFWRELRTIKTFCKTFNCTIRNDITIKNCLSTWNTYSFPNRFKVFLYKYYHNILGTGNRLIHFNNDTDVSCIFCKKNMCLPSPLESPSHIFYDCPFVFKIVDKFVRKYFNFEMNREEYFAGEFLVCNNDSSNNTSITIILDSLRYSIWELRLQKSNISYYSIEGEVLSLMEKITLSNIKIKNTILNNNFINADGDGEGARVQQGP